MDPEATVKRILLGIADNEWRDSCADAIEACGDLCRWIAKGGFKPYGWTGDQCAAFLTACLSTAETLAAK